MKNKIKSKMKKNSEKGFFNDKLLTILIFLLIALSMTILITKIVTRNYIDTDSEIVTELHNYFSYDDLGKCEGLFTYAENKVEYSNIDSELRLCLAYQKSDIKDVETGTLKATKKKNTCTEEGMVFRADEETKECSYTKIKKSIIDNTYKKLYGKKIEKNESFKIDNLNICYLKDDYYYCGLSETFTYILGNESVIYRVIKKAVEKGSEIIIYDYFAKLNNNTCFKNYTTSTINNNCTEAYTDKKEINYKFMKKYGTEYKHVFKKSPDNSYYWVSSEPVK